MSVSDSNTDWLRELARFAELSAEERGHLRARAVELTITGTHDAEPVIAALRQELPVPAADPIVAILLEKIGRNVLERADRWPLTQDTVSGWQQLYRQLGPESRARAHLLRALSAHGGAAALGAVAELLVSDPPKQSEDALLALSPLFQRRPYAAQALFPRLLDALEHPVLAAVILDLANYVTRHHSLPRHPAAERAPQLAALLEAMLNRLERVEANPQAFANSAQSLTILVGEAVALLVALCDALALVGDPSAIPKLHHALGLRHRRVQTEAAAALARLGDSAGTDALVQLAAQPLVRTRVLAYLEELGQLLKVPDEQRNPVARAEGDLAAWLAEPTHFGVPPTSLELVDSRRQYWPTFDEPVDCFLFRYEFRIGERAISGIGLAGPVTHALLADLQDLPPTDIYSVYAGWFATHEEIREIPAGDLSGDQQARWQQAQLELEAAGYQDTVLDKVGQFFGHEHFVAIAHRENYAGVVVYSDRQIYWYPASNARRPLGPTEVYSMHKGREILQTFNPPE